MSDTTQIQVPAMPRLDVPFEEWAKLSGDERVIDLARVHARLKSPRQVAMTVGMLLRLSDAILGEGNLRVTLRDWMRGLSEDIIQEMVEGGQRACTATYTYRDHLEKGDFEKNPEYWSPILQWWLHRRDDIECIRRALRLVGGSDDLDRAIAIVDRQGKPFTESITSIRLDDWRLSRVSAYDPDAWWASQHLQVGVPPQ